MRLRQATEQGLAAGRRVQERAEGWTPKLAFFQCEMELRRASRSPFPLGRSGGSSSRHRAGRTPAAIRGLFFRLACAGASETAH